MKRKYTTVPSVLSSIPSNIRYSAKSEGIEIGAAWSDIDLLNLHADCYFCEDCDATILDVLRSGGEPEYDALTREGASAGLAAPPATAAAPPAAKPAEMPPRVILRYALLGIQAAEDGRTNLGWIVNDDAWVKARASEMRSSAGPDVQAAIDTILSYL